jgi:hypothetical protein
MQQRGLACCVNELGGSLLSSGTAIDGSPGRGNSSRQQKRLEILHAIHQGKTENSMGNRLSGAFDNEETFVVQIAGAP